MPSPTAERPRLLPHYPQRRRLCIVRVVDAHKLVRVAEVVSVPRAKVEHLRLARRRWLGVAVDAVVGVHEQAGSEQLRAWWVERGSLTTQGGARGERRPESAAETMSWRRCVREQNAGKEWRAPRNGITASQGNTQRCGVWREESEGRLVECTACSPGSTPYTVSPAARAYPPAAAADNPAVRGTWAPGRCRRWSGAPVAPEWPWATPWTPPMCRCPRPTFWHGPPQTSSLSAPAAPPSRTTWSWALSWAGPPPPWAHGSLAWPPPALPASCPSWALHPPLCPFQSARRRR
eukprot:ctg_1180.g409